MSMGIVLIEVIGTSDTLNYKPFLKYCILQTILHFFCYICVAQYLLFKKLSCIQHLLDFVWGNIKGSV